MGGGANSGALFRQGGHKHATLLHCAQTSWSVLSDPVYESAVTVNQSILAIVMGPCQLVCVFFHMRLSIRIHQKIATK